ncbi:MAG TPA: LamG domain-containing protein [Kofleriaceae bacterium]|jgi:hypothetical protein
MRLVWFGALVAAPLAGCGFRAGGAAPDGASVDATPLDAAIDGASPTDGPLDAVAAPFCDGSDPDLDLCLSFDTAVVDESMNDHSELSETGISLTDRPLPVGGKDGVFLGPLSDLLFDDSIVLGADVVTIEAWIKPDAPTLSPGQRIFDANGRFWMKLTDAQALECGIFGNTNSSIPGGDRYPYEVDTDAPSNGWDSDWHHVACMYDGHSLTAWVDGDCQVMGGSVETLAPGSIGAAIGSNHNQAGVDEQFAGGLDNVRVWTIARTAEEICTAANRTNCLPGCDALR